MNSCFVAESVCVSCASSKVKVSPLLETRTTGIGINNDVFTCPLSEAFISEQI